MFGIELTVGWVVALVLYFLGGDMMAWASSMRDAPTGPRLFLALVFGWPIVTVIMTTLFLFPPLNRRFVAVTDKREAEKLKREERDDEHRGPPPPASGTGTSSC